MACQDGLYPIARDYFKRALARETESWPFVIDCLTGIALLLARTGEPALAAELLGLARQHPATERRTLVSRVEPLLTELAITLPASELAAALERGKVLNIESLANDTLTRLGAD